MKKLLSLLFIFLLVACSAKTLSTPKNLRIEDDVLSWDKVDNASKYVILIDEDEYSSKANNFDLSFLEAGTYEIKVKATAKGFNDSQYSDKIIYNKESIIDIDNKPHIISDNIINYNNQDITINFELYGGFISSISNELIKDQDYIIENDKLIIKKEFINKVDNETITIAYTLTKNVEIVYGIIIINK